MARLKAGMPRNRPIRPWKTRPARISGRRQAGHQTSSGNRASKAKVPHVAAAHSRGALGCPVEGDEPDGGVLHQRRHLGPGAPGGVPELVEKGQGVDEAQLQLQLAKGQTPAPGPGRTFPPQAPVEGQHPPAVGEQKPKQRQTHHLISGVRHERVAVAERHEGHEQNRAGEGRAESEREAQGTEQKKAMESHGERAAPAEVEERPEIVPLEAREDCIRHHAGIGVEKADIGRLRGLGQENTARQSDAADCDGDG